MIHLFHVITLTKFSCEFIKSKSFTIYNYFQDVILINSHENLLNLNRLLSTIISKMLF